MAIKEYTMDEKANVKSSNVTFTEDQQYSFDHYKNLKYFPMIVGSTSKSGWFTKHAIRSYAYTSGYSKDINLVKLFDEQNQSAQGYTDLKDKKYPYTPTASDGHYIENITDERSDDMKWNASDLKSFFQSKDDQKWESSYLFGGATSCDGDHTIYSEVFSRYNMNLLGTDRAARNLCRAITYQRYNDDATWHGDETHKVGGPFVKYRFFIYNQKGTSKSKLYCHFDTSESDSYLDYDKVISDKCVKNTYVGTIDGDNYLDQNSYKDKYVMYFKETGASKHGLLDWSRPDGKCQECCICETSYPITYAEMAKTGLDKFEFVGVRLYYKIKKFNEKNWEDAPKLEEYLTRTLDKDYSVSEMAFYFRELGGTYVTHNDDSIRKHNGSSGSANYPYKITRRKLYKYVFSLDKYQTVLRNSEQGKPVYFVPFLIDNSKEEKPKQLYEGWYGTDLSKIDGKPKAARAYTQYGGFYGDMYSINNQSMFSLNAFKGAKKGILSYRNKDATTSLDTNKTYIESGDSGLLHCLDKSDWDMPTVANTRYFKYSGDLHVVKSDNTIVTAKDLAGCVVGCFAKQPPNITAKPDGWAHSTNSDMLNVTWEPVTNKYHYNATLQICDSSNKLISSSTFEKINLSNILFSPKYNSITFTIFDPIEQGQYLGLETEEKRKSEAAKATSYGTSGHTTEQQKELEDSFDGASKKTVGKNVAYYPNNSYYELERDIVKDSIIFKGTIVLGGAKYTTDSKGEITSFCGEKKVTNASGGAFKYGVWTKALQDIMFKTEGHVNSNASVSMKNNDECEFYVTMGVDNALTHGFGLCYPAVKGKNNEIEAAFKKFMTDNKKGGWKYDGDHIRVTDPTILKGFYNKSKTTFKTRSIFKGYEVDQETAWKCTSEAITTYMYTALGYLKEVQCALNGDGVVGGNTAAHKKISDKEFFEKSIMARLNQEGWESAVDFSYNGGSALHWFRTLLCTTIANKVGAKKILTDEEKEDIYNKAVKECQGKVDSSKIQNSRKPYAKKDIWGLAAKNIVTSDYSESDKEQTCDHAYIQFTCVSEGDGRVSSHLGKRFENMFNNGNYYNGRWTKDAQIEVGDD